MYHQLPLLAYFYIALTTTTLLPLLDLPPQPYPSNYHYSPSSTRPTTSALPIPSRSYSPLFRLV